mgnify:CR=1 FL=1
MNQKRIRIDVHDKDGAKYDFKIEGNITKEKALKIFELMDLINIEEDSAPDLDSIGGKIWNIIENSFPVGKFTSSTILEKYFQRPRKVFREHSCICRPEEEKLSGFIECCRYINNQSKTALPRSDSLQK